MSLAAVPAHDERERVRGKSRKSGEERLSPRCSPNETKAREERGESGSGGVGRLRPLMHCEGDGGGCWRKGKALTGGPCLVERERRGKEGWGASGPVWAKQAKKGEGGERFSFFLFQTKFPNIFSN